MQKKFGQELSGEAAERLQNEMQTAVEKAAAKCIYGLRETLPPNLWQPCVRALRESAETERSLR